MLSPFELEVHAFVYQHRDSFGAEQVGNQGRIGPVVVISEDSVDAETRLQATQHLGARRSVATFLRDVVAGQGNNVRF